jgi:hypothetical protein
MAVKSAPGTHPAESDETAEIAEISGATAVRAHVIIHECGLRPLLGGQRKLLRRWVVGPLRCVLQRGDIVERVARLWLRS